MRRQKIAGGTEFEITVCAMWCETRGGRTYKNNVRIFSVERVQGYDRIKQYSPYNRKLSVRWGERKYVKQLSSLNEMPNHLSNIVLQER